jgi:predicted nucleic acid-binding Zn ribbon protein
MKRSPLKRPTPEARLTVPAKDCTVCSKPFLALKMGRKVCSPKCAGKVAKIARAAEKAQDKERRAALETQPQWVAKAQIAFNAFIRARDAGKPCICCGMFPKSYSGSGGEWDAGHYRSRGAAPELRFDERNCHAQLKRCNRRAWDVAGYRENLIKRIGLEELESLEGPHPPKKWTVDQLKEIKAHYSAKTKALLGKE